MNGYAATVFAYGQTGSGKTFTMDGNEGESRGIIQRTVLQLFEISAQNPLISYTFKITMLEIYNETIKDLLAPQVAARSWGSLALGARLPRSLRARSARAQSTSTLSRAL